MISAILAKLRGAKFSALDLVKFAWNKGGLTLVRGSLAMMGNPRGMRFPFLLGKGTRLLHKNYFTCGRMCYIGDFSYINCLSNAGVHFGDRVTLREFAWLQLTSDLSNPGEGIFVGDNTYIGPRCNLGAAAVLRIGEKCQIGAGVSFIAENHNFKEAESIFEAGVNRRGIEIGNDCWIGNNAIILDGVTLGAGCVVAAGAVVTKSFPAGSVLMGVPAKARSAGGSK